MANKNAKIIAIHSRRPDNKAMHEDARNLTLDELRLVLQNQYRRFISGVQICRYADGRPYVKINFADAGANDNEHTRTMASGG